MQGNLWTVAVLACALVLLIPLAGAGYDDATQPREANETAEVVYSNPYELQQQDVAGYGNLTVTNSSGTQLVNTTDYTFDRGNGEVDFSNTSKTSSGELVTVNYTFFVHTEAQRTSETVLASLAPWLGLLLVVAAMGYLFVLVAGGTF